MSEQYIEERRERRADRHHRYTIRLLANLMAAEYLEREREALLGKIIDDIEHITSHRISREYAGKIFDMVSGELRERSKNVNQLPRTDNKDKNHAEGLSGKGAQGDSQGGL